MFREINMKRVSRNYMVWSGTTARPLLGYRSCWRSDEVESYIEFRTRIHRGTGAARNQPSHAQAA